jgi:hypothetical protein
MAESVLVGGRLLSVRRVSFGGLIPLQSQGVRDHTLKGGLSTMRSKMSHFLSPGAHQAAYLDSGGKLLAAHSSVILL